MPDSLHDVLGSRHENLAIVVGNGINLHAWPKSTGNSWEIMLRKMWTAHNGAKACNLVKEITLTEFYDAIDLHESAHPGESLQREFCDTMADWQPGDVHREVVAWAKARQRPILTTNFEKTLALAADAEKRRLRPIVNHHKKTAGFSRFYPWDIYYAPAAISAPDKGFGIWHINGVVDYMPSVRLGLTHYMGSVSRAREWLHRKNESSLFSGKNVHGWEGHNTWLHIIFNCDLVFVGLGLNSDEVFLRWLLIERKRYFRQFDRPRKGWYFAPEQDLEGWKEHYLRAVDIEPIAVPDYPDLWNEVWCESLPA